MDTNDTKKALEAAKKLEESKKKAVVQTCDHQLPSQDFEYYDEEGTIGKPRRY
jgi:hypothetical protein